MCVSVIKPNEPTRDYIRYSNYSSRVDQHNTTTTHATTSELLPRTTSELLPRDSATTVC